MPNVRSIFFKKHGKMAMFLRDRLNKMLILLNFAQKSLSFHPQPPLAFGRIFTHGLTIREGGGTSGHDCY